MTRPSGGGAGESMATAKRTAELIRLFEERAPIARFFGMHLSYNEEGGAVVDLPYNPNLDHALGGIHGGLGGAASRPVGVRAVYDIYDRVDVPIIGVGGVDSGMAALEYIMAGASAVQIGTALVAGGLGVFEHVTKEMNSVLEDIGFKSVSEAVGVAHG